MILVDTSVWVDYLRGLPSAATIELRRILATLTDQVCLCEPIAMELLAGASPAQLPAVARLVDGLRSLPVDPFHDYRAAAAIYRRVRATGHTVRALNDCLIAAIAHRHQVLLLHKDVDFERISKVTGQPADSRR